MSILVACEESQRVCEAFRKRGHIAFSCDTLEPSGNHPEWHIQADVIPLLNGNCAFTTLDGVGIPYAKAYEITRTASRSVILNLSIAMSNPEIEIESDNPIVIG